MRQGRLLFRRHEQTSGYLLPVGGHHGVGDPLADYREVLGREFGTGMTVGRADEDVVCRNSEPLLYLTTRIVDSGAGDANRITSHQNDLVAPIVDDQCLCEQIIVQPLGRPGVKVSGHRLVEKGRDHGDAHADFQRLGEGRQTQQTSQAQQPLCHQVTPHFLMKATGTTSSTSMWISVYRSLDGSQRLVEVLVAMGQGEIPSRVRRH